MVAFNEKLLLSGIIIQFWSLCYCVCFKVAQKWVEITTDTQVDVLTHAVNHGLHQNSHFDNGIVRTMVFVNTVEAAEVVANILMAAGVECLRYHSDVSFEERTDNIVAFQETGGVFVCTDDAARGLDVPTLSHFIQALVRKPEIADKEVVDMLPTSVEIVIGDVVSLPL